MASKKPKHFFLEWLRCYKKTPEALELVKRQYSHPHLLSEGTVANPQLLGSRNPVNQGADNQLSHQIVRPEIKDTPIPKDQFQNAKFTSASSTLTQNQTPALDMTHSIFQPAESFVQHMQLEVREVLRSINITQNKTSNLQTSQTHAATSSAQSAVNKETLFSTQRNLSTQQISNPSANFSIRATLLNFQDNSAQHVSDNFFNGSFELLGLQHLSVEQATSPLRLTSHSQVPNNAQSILPKNFIQTASHAINTGLFHSLDSSTEGLHLVSWAKQLGVTPQVLYTLLPALLHFQEASPSAKPFLQGLMLFYGLFTGASQSNISNLTWVLLKGMMILETQTQLSQAHSPLLDELGALLSTSRKRIRRRNKKRRSGIEKVSRKETCLADLNAQETTQDNEALIDLWPKKESNNPAMSFFYM